MLAIGEGPETKALLDFARPIFALYIGGMGAKGKNFYNDLACAYGYEKEATEIQELYLAGKRMEAIAAVPDELVDEVALVGTRERVADRLDAWKESGVKTLLIQAHDPATLRTLRAAVQRVCAASVPVPYSPTLEQAALPDRARIAAAIRRTLG